MAGRFEGEGESGFGFEFEFEEAGVEVGGGNPVLDAWPGPYGGVPPWGTVQPSHFPEAFEVAIARRAAEIEAIASSPDAPTFDNTFVPLEDAGRDLDRVLAVFGVMTNNLSTPEYQALDSEWSPRLAAAFDETIFDARLFRRIESVYEARLTSGLTAEQQRLVERTYEQFVENGAALDDAGKAELGRMNQELAGLFVEFATRILNDEDTYTLIADEARLDGIPGTVRDSYRAAAEERGLDGWAVVNARSGVDPFLTFATDRALREQVWRRFKQRGDNGDGNDTNEVMSRIVALRSRRAELLGFATHAHWRLTDSMAGTPEQADALMQRVWPAAVARVRQEVADMQAVASAEGDPIEIEPWDYLYYAEKVRRQRYDLDQNEVKPYFELKNMIRAAYWTAEQLYGLTFREVTAEVPVFHPDVTVWDVTEGDRHVGLFYMDPYARTGKRSGAWATSYRSHESFRAHVTPLVSNNNNFTRGRAGEPVLISLDDAETLFHEFGHALHSLLSEVRYPGLQHTPRDFVEFPSQVLEHWVLTRPVLDRFARHYLTGEPMPQALVDRIRASETFNQGHATVEYLSAALLDMMIHTRSWRGADDDAVEGAGEHFDARRFEREALEEIGMPREIVLRHRLPHFLHLFSSDSYSAGYYSYLWAEVMDADTWAAFEESGDVFDRTLADGMRRHMLAPGNSTDRAEAYRQFRGRDPEVDALLRGRGLI